MYLLTKWFGTFLFDKKGISKKILFPKIEKEIIKRLLIIEKNEILKEEKDILKQEKNIIVNERRLTILGEYKPLDSFFKNFSIKPDDFGFSQDILNKSLISLSQKKVNERLKSKDLQIIQMVNALDDFIQISNLLLERIESWNEIKPSEEKIKPVTNAYTIINNEMKSLEKQIIEDMEKTAPNISKITGSLIGARLISQAGGINRLALLPASTIQILGAEKALFRFKKEGGRPPKHGIIFQHPYVNKTIRKHRGKVARVLSNKISIASKADVFTNRDISKDLQKDLEKRLSEIRNVKKNK